MRNLEVIIVMTRFLLALALSCVVLSDAQAVLDTGDIAFIGFNADGGHDFSIVALNDISNETLYFTDMSATSSGGLAGNDYFEGRLQWSTGSSVIAAGTVVTFLNVALSERSSSVGTLVESESTFRLNSGGDSILAYQGTAHTPSHFLAGIENKDGAIGDFAAAGLTEGLTFLDFSNGGTNGGSSPDGGYYQGPRSGLPTFSAYLSEIHNPANWATEPSNGTNVLPFNTTSFTVAAIPEPTAFLFGGFVAGLVGIAAARRPLRRC